MNSEPTNNGVDPSLYDLFHSTIKQHIGDEMVFGTGVYIPTSSIRDVHQCKCYHYAGSPRKVVAFEFTDGTLFFAHFSKGDRLFDSIDSVCEQVNKQLQIYKVVTL